MASKKSTTGYPKSLSLNNQESSSVEGICNLFAAFFKDVYVDSGISENVILGSIHLSRDAILKSLLSINVNKGNGPDDIPPVCLKHCADALAAPSF